MDTVFLNLPFKTSMDSLVRECLLRNSRFKNVSKTDLIIRIVKLEEEVCNLREQNNGIRLNTEYFKSNIGYLERVKNEMISAIEDERNIKIVPHTYDTKHVSIMIAQST